MENSTSNQKSNSQYALQASDRPPKGWIKNLKPKASEAELLELPRSLTPEQIAEATDAINYVLVAAGVPEKFRAFIDALIGASMGSMDWFEASDFEIGQRMREVSSQDQSRGSIEKSTQRMRKDFVEWQAAYARTLIESMPGGQSASVNYRSQYKLANLFTLALDTDQAARESYDWDRNRKRALRRSAKMVFEAQAPRLNQPPNRKRFRGGRRETSGACLKLIKTYKEKMCGLALLEGVNLAQLLEEIELDCRETREKLTNFPHFQNEAKAPEPVEFNSSSWVDTFVHSPEADFVHTSPKGTMDKPEAWEGEPKAGRGCDSFPVTERPIEESHPPGGPPEFVSESQAGGLDVSQIFPQQFQGDLALAAVESVGADQVEWFFVDPETDSKTGPYHPQSIEDFRRELTEIITDAERGGVSLVVRVRGPLLQLDDCSPAAVALLKPLAFMIEETSENNFQAWLAFKDDEDKLACRDRLFAQLRDLCPGLNPGAGGATRWPGSINQKPDRNAWRVRLAYVNQGRVTTPAELEALELLGDLEPQASAAPQKRGAGSGAWPDYEKCLEAKGGDRSRADSQFVFFALKSWHSPEEIQARLIEVSERARESGPKYVGRTIAAGLQYVALSRWRRELQSDNALDT